MCLWEAGSIDALRDYLDPATEEVAENTYFEVDTQRAMGFPKPLRQAPSTPAHTGPRGARR